MGNKGGISLPPPPTAKPNLPPPPIAAPPKKAPALWGGDDDEEEDEGFMAKAKPKAAPATPIAVPPRNALNPLYDGFWPPGAPRPPANSSTESWQAWRANNGRGPSDIDKHSWEDSSRMTSATHS